ncbi:Uncharacterised protein [Serratia entomophila]|nr:Uncharacterised protein [Serratia entomophila]CAI1190520.1 Uncharacterised protein [Serratia entomophila]CAI1979236.1 Uncharacterised protein [Serratia entomophila]CAI1985876.1 Uncharacterised protein [Serratia entomophila]CAI2007696.1 Uncharacterised protein [Serratia entomophila]
MKLMEYSRNPLTNTQWLGIMYSIIEEEILWLSD